LRGRTEEEQHESFPNLVVKSLPTVQHATTTNTVVGVNGMSMEMTTTDMSEVERSEVELVSTQVEPQP
jgi:hypothetical protein